MIVLTNKMKLMGVFDGRHLTHFILYLSGSHLYLTSAFMVYLAEPSQVVRIGAQRHDFHRERRFNSYNRKYYQ